MTSNHEGVSCDFCRKNNFPGLRYKCLVCRDYDLCSSCYDHGYISSQHGVNHPTQCIIAKNDYDLFYLGETVSTEQPVSLTCPFCGTMGFTESTLLDHVTSEHGHSDNDESSAGVVCPICGVETNQLTYDFATHMTMEHRAPRENMEHNSMRGRGGRCHGRAAGSRGRRAQPQHTSAADGSPSSRENPDPLVEILAQLGARRVGGGSSQSSASIHQLQMHLQSSPSFLPRPGNEVRIVRRTFGNSTGQHSALTHSAVNVAAGIHSTSGAHYCSTQPFFLLDQSSSPSMVSATAGAGTGINLTQIAPSTAMSGQLGSESTNISSQYLLGRCMKPLPSETEQQQHEILRADRSLFVQELLLQLGLLETTK